MHVGIFHTRAGSHHAGGKAVFVRNIARALAADHEVTLFTQFDPDSDTTAELTAAGVDLVAVGNGWLRPVTPLVERWLPLHPDPLLPLLEGLADGVVARIEESVDVLFTHRFLEDLVLSTLVDVPVAYQYHNVQSVGTGANAREFLSASSIHLANSHAVAADVKRRLGRSVDGIVSPGVDTERFSPDVPSAIDIDGPTVLFVGRVVAGKGVLDLLDALAAMERRPTLVVVGDGDIDTVRKRARARGVADALRFEGEVPHEALPGYYAGADVFCNPTHYEGFGMVNVEAMACGTPVVTTRIDGVSEYTRDGENALLVTPESPAEIADALDTLLGSAQRRARLGRAGRETAEAYDWGTQAERLVEICRQSANKGQKSDKLARNY